MPRGGSRPGAGRKRTEPALKRLRGTDRADRDSEAAPPAVPGGMPPPFHLSEHAQGLFATAHGIMIRKRPEVQMLGDAMRHAHALLAELMITPATALRLGQGDKPEDNPFKALLEL